MAPKFLKQRLVQEFQHQQQQVTLAAQASRAAEQSGSDQRPHSSGTKGPEAIAGTDAHTEAVAAVVATSEHAPPAPGPQPPSTAATEQQETRMPGGGSAKASARSGPPPAATALPRLPSAPPRGALARQPSLKREGTDLLRRKQTSSKLLPGAGGQKRKAAALVGTPLDVLADGGTRTSLGTVEAASCASYSELWTAVSKACGDRVNRASARLVYQDDYGDWLVLMPDSPFAMFTGRVQRLLVLPNKRA